MKGQDYHITKRESGWAGMLEGAVRASVRGDTQKEVFERVREIIKSKGGGEVSIHGLDGKIRDKRTYIKKDPCPPMG